MPDFSSRDAKLQNSSDDEFRDPDAPFGGRLEQYLLYVLVRQISNIAGRLMAWLVGNPVINVSCKRADRGDTFIVKFGFRSKPHLPTRSVMLRLLMRETAIYSNGRYQETLRWEYVTSEFERRRRHGTPFEGMADTGTRFELPHNAMHTFVATNNRIQWLVLVRFGVNWWLSLDKIKEIVVRPDSPPTPGQTGYSALGLSQSKAPGPSGHANREIYALRRARDRRASIQVCFDRETIDEIPCFRPGDRISGRVEIEADRNFEPGEAVAQLVWFTEGSGKADERVVGEQTIRLPDRMLAGTATSDRFSFDIPPRPWSYSGHLVNIRWAVYVLIDVPREPSIELEQLIIITPD